VCTQPQQAVSQSSVTQGLSTSARSKSTASLSSGGGSGSQGVIKRLARQVSNKEKAPGMRAVVQYSIGLVLCLG